MLGWLLPCPVCDAAPSGRHGACPACRARLRALAGRAAVADDVVALGAYRGDVAKAVHAAKFGGGRRLARVMGEALAAAVTAQRWRVGWVVPVPLHPERRRARGFDQARLVAEGVARRLGAPLRLPLRRVRATRRQARLPGAARPDNVRGAFVCRRVPPVPVLLVDDVVTTGATVAACRRALLRAGAREVRVAALARAGADHRPTANAVAPPTIAPTTTWG